ncbi:hypothetical protein [Alteromonas sp. a30]|uniref:hypothetical protein n=1 Tax=Alteromonas sp. a30 TaxID=2730917 RepID=UPI00227E5159|nr:hypothetical protein [Alteromonas sp. a30]MCY7295661.1 hypothetical protein [Alteromonas sp. a30]
MLPESVSTQEFIEANKKAEKQIKAFVGNRQTISASDAIILTKTLKLSKNSVMKTFLRHHS